MRRPGPAPPDDTVRPVGTSRDRRERLVSPLGLVLTGVAFAVAFGVLAPSRDAFVLDAIDAAADATARGAEVDELRVAYLKARAAAGELDVDEARRALTALAREGRMEDARTLLEASSGLALDAVDRLSLDAELAAGGVRRAGAESGHEAAREALVTALERLLAGAGPDDVAALERGVVLASRIDDPRLAAAFHSRLADVDRERAALHLARCGRLLAARGRSMPAISCLARARAASADRAERFALGLELLPLLPAEPTDARRRALVDELLAHRPTSVAELDALATTLLAIERPDAAARVYARLADADAAARGRWLSAAARWSEAADRPAEAAVYLDRMAPADIDGDPDAHRRRIERLLVGAGRTRDALERVAVRVARTPTDPEAVRDAVRLAEAEGELARALDWNAALLVARPDDVEALGRQAALALAVGRPDLARGAAARAQALDPDDVGALERLANLAEWDGDPEAALRHRRHLVELRGTDADLLEVARLAELVRRPAIAAEALAELARRVPPDADAIARIVRLHELDGRPDAAADALEAISARHGTRARTLRELAALHRRHLRHREALATWTRFADVFGRSAEETLARVELHWRLGEEDRAAALAEDLERLTFGGGATSYQASLLAEIGWRYRLRGVAAFARPLLASVGDADQRLLHARRAVESLAAAGDDAKARREAETLWRMSGETELALIALRLAIESGDEADAERLLAATADVEALRALPEYWSLRATVALRQGDAAAARRGYRTALGIDPDDVEAIGGLLWLHVGENDVPAIEAMLGSERERALSAPTLWTAFAVGHMSTGDAAGSLPWFERALDTSGADYGLLLTFADALETSDRIDHARRVRRHAVAALRPALLDGVAADREPLLRRYGAVLARYGGADANEAWMRYVLATEDGATGGSTGGASFWREDMAISWLMATERHEHARLIMARLHERRLATPAWQDLALALRAGDDGAARAMLASGTGLSAGNRILALRRVGREADAWTLALATLDGPASDEDRRVAAAEYTAMARRRPSDARALARATSGGGLDVVETGVAVRRTFGATGMGLGVEAVRERFAADAIEDADGRARTDVALRLFHETSRRDVSLALGLSGAGDDDVLRGEARYARRDRDARRELAITLARNESATGHPSLRLGALRSRAGASFDAALGVRGFTRFALEANEIAARVDERRVARGVAARTELGFRGTAGTLAWSGSVAAAGADNDRVEILPASLRTFAGAALDIDDVIARRTRTLSLNGSLARGDIGDAFPRSASPRWFVAGGVSRALASGALGLQLDAGAGLRVLGDDELAVAFTREARLSGSGVEPDSTALGLSYRHRF